VPFRVIHCLALCRPVIIPLCAHVRSDTKALSTDTVERLRFEDIDLLVDRPESCVDLSPSLRGAAQSRFERLQILKGPGAWRATSGTERSWSEAT